jgi:hypothetical protein
MTGTCVCVCVYTYFVGVWFIIVIVISSYHSNELLSINTLDERNLCSRSQTIEQHFVSVYRVYSVSIDNILMWVCEVWYTLQGRLFTIDCVCYSWEMALYVGLVSFDNM